MKIKLSEKTAIRLKSIAVSLTSTTTRKIITTSVAAIAAATGIGVVSPETLDLVLAFLGLIGTGIF